MIVSAQARRDLHGIQTYITRVSGTEIARQFVLRISAHLERIALTGHTGVPRDAVRPGLRLVVHGRYNIYFRTTEQETVIVRVIHGARNILRMRFED